MKNFVPVSRFSVLSSFIILFILQHGSAHAYTLGEADTQLNAATAELGAGNCASADKFLERADVTIDQILRSLTMRGCLAQPLNNLRTRAGRLAGLSVRLQRECGMRRSYGNTLGKVRSWENTRPCGAPNNAQRCQQYANTAVRAQQININKNCGFTGQPWSNNYTGHYTWCLGASSNAAHQETQARKILIDNCAVPGNWSGFIGTWKWFTGSNVIISGDHRVSTPGNSGTWRGLPSGGIEIQWQNGGWIDTLSISADGRSLTGRNQHGTIVTATSVSPSDGHQAMLYDIQTPPYGGGRHCLTAEEAKRIKNAPNTVMFKPVGKSCSK